MPAGSTVGTAVALNETSMSFGPWLLKKISPGVSAKFVRCSTAAPSKSRSLFGNKLHVEYRQQIQREADRAVGVRRGSCSPVP